MEHQSGCSPSSPACLSSSCQAASPIVNYAGGKDYARGTKFRCGLKRCRSLHDALLATASRPCASLAAEPTREQPPGAFWIVPHLSLPLCLHLCSCMATSGDGYVVVGADDGKVRGRVLNSFGAAETRRLPARW